MLLSTHKTAVCLLALVCASSLGLQAQAAGNDMGTMVINGQLAKATCILSIGDTEFEGTSSKELKLGSLTDAQVPSTAGTEFGAMQYFVLTLRDATDKSKPCDLLTSNTLWDVGINLSSNQFGTLTGGRTFLTNSATTNAATNIGVVLTTIWRWGDILSSSLFPIEYIDFNAPTGPYGVLLSGRNSIDLGTATFANLNDPFLGSPGWIKVGARFVKTSSSNANPGAFSVALPLNVWYR